VQNEERGRDSERVGLYTLDVGTGEEEGHALSMRTILVFGAKRRGAGTASHKTSKSVF
jgi:hypothetical protein